MSNKKAILLVLAGEALIYLFLLVGFPVFTDWMYAACDTCTSGRDAGTPWPLYILPGVLGVFIILVILTGKRRVKESE